MERSSKYENYTREQLLAEVEKLSKRKKYGLVWEEEKTKEQFEKEAEDKLPVLVEDKKREIKTDLNKPTNILIEGDNYHALSVLNYTHPKGIDVIYIDPPYNTGNNDFKYNDKYIDREDTYRHSKWLSFMSKRLKLAKKLISDSGAIFISIDDHEQHTLRLLCDEIFGAENFIQNIIWQRAYAPVNLNKFFSQNHDFVLVYCKNISKFIFNKLLRTEENNKDYKNIDNDPRGPWKAGNPSVGPAVEKNIYKIKTPSGRVLLPPQGRSWLYSKEKFEILKKDNRIWFGKDGGSVWAPKLFLSEVSQTMTPLSIWTYKEVGHTQDAKKELKELFNGEDRFATPKPVSLIKRVLSLVGNKQSIVLDFFAGSGSTGQAVLELNKEDGGNRQFILCTNNENNICTEVCYPRIEKVIKGYKNSKGEKVHGLGGNLKYYKTDFVASEPSHRNKKLLTLKSIEMLCTKENTFHEVKTGKHYFIFSNKEKYTAILLDESSLTEFKKEISWLDLPVSVYVFALEDYDYSDEFSDLKHDISVCTIPEAILKVYRRIYQKGQLKMKLSYQG